MSDTVVVALIAAVGANVGVVFGYLNRRTLHSVHNAVNGGLQDVKDELAAAQRENRRLRRELDRATELLAARTKEST